MAKVNFDSIFIQHPDGTLEPRQRIRVGGVEFGPGVRFSKGASFAGIDFTLFVEHDLEVDEENSALVIKAIYK